MVTRWRIALALLFAIGTSLAAQTPGITGPRPSPLFISSLSQDTAAHQAIVYNWQEPALVGGALLGGLTNLFVYGFCADGEGSGSMGDKCALGGEVGFLMGATVGGGIAGLIGSTSKARVTPPGYVLDGDRRVHGALMLAIPSLAVNGYGIVYQCNRRPTFSTSSDGCNPGNVAWALLSAVVNGWIGAEIGKGIPAYRKIE